MTEKVDALIIGAGVIGSSVAMHLAQLGMNRVRVMDFDLEGSLSSSELNAGGVRATWVHPLNIELSRQSIEYFAQVADQVGYKACGYLWLHPPERIKAALEAREKQIELGWPVQVWDIPELKRKIPFLDKTEGIAGALFAPRDGLINPNLLKNHFRAEACARGVVFDDRTLLREVKYPDQAGGRIRVLADRFESAMSHESKLDVLTSERTSTPTPQTTQERRKVEYEAQYIVNCTGPWASQVAELLGYRSPSFPVRRQVSIFDGRDVDLSSYGMIVDTSGVYFHPEATHGLAGFASPNEDRGYHFAYDGEAFFTEVIWPALYERSTCFEKLKHVTGWAGLYEVSPDEFAIIGPVTQGAAGRHFGISGGVFEAHSFSGHGVMQSYSAGKALAERMVKGRYESVDLSLLSGERFESGSLIREKMVI